MFASKEQAKVPRLVQMYRESVGGKPSSSTQGVEAVKMELAETQQKYTKVASKLQEITRSYHSLVGISTEMVTALETAVKEKMVGSCACILCEQSGVMAGKLGSLTKLFHKMQYFMRKPVLTQLL